MDATTFGLDLQEALDDAGGAVYTAAARASAIRRALAQHALYRPRRERVTLQLAAGTGDYELPAGFLAPEPESLARALGGPGSVRRRGGFHDGAWEVARSYSGTGAGYRQGFSGAYPYPFPAPCGVGIGATLDFMEGDPPTLRIDPAPSAAREFAFDGLFPPTLASCPETDREPLLCLARAFCLEARARKLGSKGKWSEGDASEDAASGARALLDQAQSAREEYKDMVRNRPMAVGG